MWGTTARSAVLNDGPLPRWRAVVLSGSVRVRRQSPGVVDAVVLDGLTVALVPVHEVAGSAVHDLCMIPRTIGLDGGRPVSPLLCYLSRTQAVSLTPIGPGTYGAGPIPSSGPVIAAQVRGLGPPAFHNTKASTSFLAIGSPNLMTQATIACPRGRPSSSITRRSLATSPLNTGDACGTG